MTKEFFHARRMMKKLIILLLLLTSATSAFAQSVEELYPILFTPSRKFALLVGITDYANAPKLKCCVKDIQTIEQQLKDGR